MSAESLILFFIVGAFLVGFAIVFAHFAAPNSTNPQKAEPYECGIPTEGLTWLRQSKICSSIILNSKSYWW